MRRLQKIDIARGVALVGMALYHFSWDLAFFGYIADYEPQNGVLLVLARCVAAAFLFLAGFSLFLAQGGAFHSAAFIRRFIVIAACAAAVSAASRLFMPQDFIYFGILHALACAALAGLLFLHTPLWLNGAVIALCFYLPQAGFDLPYPALWWLGLSRDAAPSFDYVPFFPWFAWALAGQSLAGLMARRGLLPVLQNGIKPLFLSRFLQFLGRHSLIFYLLHQPILLAGLYVFAAFVPPCDAFERASWQQDCVASCRLDNPAAACRDFCACALGKMAENSPPGAFRAESPAADDEAALAIARQCAARFLAAPPGAAQSEIRP